MKSNSRLQLEVGIYMVVILAIIGLLVRGHFRAEHFENTKQWAQEKTVLDYINSKEDLKPVAFGETNSRRHG
jgi:formylmethanofuran dehydrogenase subunit A